LFTYEEGNWIGRINGRINKVKIAKDKKRKIKKLEIK